MNDEHPTRRDASESGLAVGVAVFGRFELESFVGRGGMGVVWRARDAELGEAVALKFLPDVLARDEAAIDELRQETRRARQLTHENIVRIHDFLRADRLAAVSMELVDGPTLTALRLAQPTKVFTVEALAPLVVQLCTALDFAHLRAKIVHRDLKPANVLVTRGGEVKVTDFGIARSMTESATRLTGKGGGGSASGTLPYMSPQQVLGQKPTAADDLYSLGALLYELLTSKPPFFRGDGYALMKQIETMNPPLIVDRRIELELTGGEIPAAWQKTIHACLAKRAEDRPANGADILRRLNLIPAAAPGVAINLPTKSATSVPSASSRSQSPLKYPKPGETWADEPVAVPTSSVRYGTGNEKSRSSWRMVAVIVLACAALVGATYYYVLGAPARAEPQSSLAITPSHSKAANPTQPIESPPPTRADEKSPSRTSDRPKAESSAPTNAVVVEPQSAASREFRTVVANLKIGGVFEGKPTRAFLNDRLVREGQLMMDLEIVFVGVDPARRILMFRDATGAEVARRY
jgi:serine/threonine protein kinase